MPVTIKAANVKYKSPSTGQYVGVNSVSDNTTADQITAINAAGQQQINAVQITGQQTIASIPVDYTNLSNEVTDLKSALEQSVTMRKFTDASIWEAGNLGASTGSASSSTTLCTISFIKPSLTVNK